MSTAEKLVEILKRKHAEAVDVEVTHVALKVEEAAGLLAYIAELEAKVAESDTTPKLGDTVVALLGDNRYTGRRGRVIRIESLAPNRPFSVEFKSTSGPGVTILYFAEHEIQKVV